MSDSYDSRFLDDPEFQSVLVGCLESLQRGETIDRIALAKDFPRYAKEIGQFLDDQQLLEQVASGFGDVQPSRIAISAYANTMDSGSGQKDFGVGESIRYIGEYEVLDEIARGGMGVVFKARQKTLNRVVALKMILAGRLADSSDIERFQREARAAGRLKHPSIVPVHEIGEHDGRHYFTMDFVDGRSLAEILRDETLAPRAAAKLVQSVAKAVQYAHDEGTVHRDLKPGNVLLDEAGMPKVTDFGLAKMLGGVDDETRAELTASGQVLGTPSYMSPEQASGKQELVGPASDIYSLGAILYASLTGRAPFVADSPVDTLLQVMNKEPISPRDLNPSVPKDLETICLKCLTKEPHKRYGTAQELAEDLGRFLEGRPVIARPIGGISKTARWCRRNPIVASLAALVFASLVSGTAISAFYANVANRHAESEEAQRELAEEALDEAEQERKLAEQRGEDLRRQLYVAHIPRALDEWNNGNTVGVRHLLAQHIPQDDEEDLRGFEWYWLDNLTKSWRLKIETEREILDADVSGDGSVLATIGGGRMMIHRLDDGREVHEFPVPITGHASVRFDSSGKFLAAGHDRLQLWSVDQERTLWESKRESSVVWVGITSDDRWIVSISGTQGKRDSWRIQVHDFSMGDLIREISVPDVVFTAEISPNGKQLAATCYDNKLRIWDLSSGVQLKEWTTSGSMVGLTFSPDGRWLTTGSPDGTLSRHDAIRGKRVETWRKQSNSFRRVASHSSGQPLAVAGAPQIAYLLDFKTGEVLKEFRGHEAEVTTVAFRPAVEELVSCDRTGVIHVWDTRENQGFLRCQGAEELVDLSEAAFHSDMKWFAKSEGISWRREQKGTVRLYNLPSGSTGPVLDGHESGVFGVAIVGDRVFSAGHDGKLIVWDTKDSSQIHARNVDQPITTLAVSADGLTQAVGTGIGKILVYRGQQEDRLAEFSIGTSKRRIDDVALSPIGNFVVGRAKSALRVFDYERNLSVLEVDHIAAGPVAFSTSGESFAVVMGGKVRIYDTSTWEIVEEFRAHAQPITGIAYGPDDRRCATRSADGKIKLWETKTWQNLLSIPLSYRDRNDLFAPIFSPDGKYLVVGRDGVDACLLSTTKSTRKQTLDAGFFDSRAKAFTRRQRWSEAFQEYERLMATGSTDHPWAIVHAAEVAAFIKPSDQTRRRILEGAMRAKHFEESDLQLASRLVLAAQLRPGTDPAPEDSLRIAKRAWQELGKPSGESLTYTLFRQGKDGELVQFKNKHSNVFRSSATNQLLFAGALFRLGQIHEACIAFELGADRFARDTPPLGQDRYIEREGISEIIFDVMAWREISTLAMDSLNEAIDSNPDDSALLSHRGLLHRRWHRWDQALVDLERALELDPDNRDYLEAAAVTSVLTNDSETASKLADRFVGVYESPAQIELIWFPARVAVLAPESERINESLLQKVRIASANAPKQHWRRLAVVMLSRRLGHLDESMRELEHIEKNMSDITGATAASLKYLRGLILYERGKIREAEVELRKGESIDRLWAPQPGSFPKIGRQGYVDCVVLHRELRTMLEDERRAAATDQPAK